MNQVLALSHARKSYDGKVVLDDVTLAFLPGAKICVVGPNGTGGDTGAFARQAAICADLHLFGVSARLLDED